MIERRQEQQLVPIVPFLPQVSFLERASLVEAAAQRAELEARVTRITEDLRRAAQTEMHSTTRRALQENEALTRQLEVFRGRITSLRAENTSLRESLSDSQVILRAR